MLKGILPPEKQEAGVSAEPTEPEILIAPTYPIPGKAPGAVSYRRGFDQQYQNCLCAAQRTAVRARISARASGCQTNW